MEFRLAYVGVQVRDLDRSVAFYRDVLGMSIGRRERVPETQGEWAELRSPGSPLLLELNWYPEGSKHFRGPYRHGDELDHLAFDCEDADAAYRELVAKGARAALPPFTEGGSRLAFVQDPDGVWIELSSAARPSAQS
jgi:lactoylglutathione lyase